MSKNVRSKMGDKIKRSPAEKKGRDLPGQEFISDCRGPMQETAVTGSEPCIGLYAVILKNRVMKSPNKCLCGRQGKWHLDEIRVIAASKEEARSIAEQHVKSSIVIGVPKWRRKLLHREIIHNRTRMIT